MNGCNKCNGFGWIKATDVTVAGMNHLKTINYEMYRQCECSKIEIIPENKMPPVRKYNPYRGE